MSWYKTKTKFTIKQRAYLKLLEKTFKIKNVKNEVVNYAPRDYQKEMHAFTPMALDEKDWKNILIYKGRGLGASYIRMMDAILHCIHFPTGLIVCRFSYYQCSGE